MGSDPGENIHVATRTIDLIDIDNSILETMAVRKAISENKPVIYFAPNPDDPRDGYYVRMPPIIQAIYRCSNCTRIVVATMFMPDVISGKVAKTRQCTDCKSKMILRALGPERERPVVIRERPKVGLEEFIEGD